MTQEISKSELTTALKKVVYFLKEAKNINKTQKDGVAVSYEEIEKLTDDYTPIVWEILKKRLMCKELPYNCIFVDNNEYFNLHTYLHKYVERYTTPKIERGKKALEKPEGKEEKKEKKAKARPKKQKSKGGRPKKEIDTKKLFDLRKKGKTIRVIAKELKISTGLVHKRLKKR